MSVTTEAEPRRASWNPAQLARLLDLPEPTHEQAEVIAAPLTPSVVVAGAGSGKSETMAARVVWLVANGHVRPEQVLGLTFTRKAATELADRVRRRLDQLRGVDAVPAEILDGEPAVSTYHSYAARIVGDHALREAVEPSIRLVTDAVAWQLASRVVAGYDGPMDAITATPASVVGDVLELAGELAEHLRGPDDVREIGQWLRRRAAELSVKKLPADTATLLTTQEKREQLLPLVEAYAAAKSAREVMDYGDQIALAARIAERHPEVGLIERDRYRVVLLDEYQDTSHAQLVLLRSLFGDGHPVTAVGDPCQSIYGWRGASSGNLLRFPTDFPERLGRSAPVRQLATSFRNGERVLRVARAVSEALRAETEHVPVLHPGPARRGRGFVTCALLDTETAEAEWLAEQIELALQEPGRRAPDGAPWPDGEAPPDGRLHPGDVAVLCRKRAQFPAIRAALEARGIPVEVVGLGGLLTVPEVRDIVATLRVLHDPTAGNELVRLLTGPRHNLGPRDLVALGARAAELAEHTHRDLATEPGADAERGDPLRQTVLDLTAESGSLVDALDDPGPAENYSPTGHERITRLAAELRTLRRQVVQPLPELIGEVERALGLDIEVAARPGRDPVAARADLDAFVDAAIRFTGNSEDPTLGTFLSYLASAEDTEHGLETGRVGSSDSVKLMTVHGSKGLQWPLVVVPGLCGGTSSPLFPARPRRRSSWARNERTLPFALRGDRADLPELTGVDRAALQEFEAATKDREQLEERRLAYVAVTRASFALLCTGHWWGTTAAARRGPSVFLEEVRAVCAAGGGRVAHWAPPPEDGATNPQLAEEEPVAWPSPAEERPGFAAVIEAAHMVTAARDGAGERWLSTLERAGLPDGLRRRVAGWQRDVDLLLAHRDRARPVPGGAVPVELPDHLTVSALVSLARDPVDLARQVRRPLPRPPAPHTRRGTTFHAWLAARFGAQQDLLGPDELPGAADETAVDTDLARLQRGYEASEWGPRTPVAVEVPFETIIGDRLVRGRMDAVFADAPEGGFDVVDWKTGRMPRTAAERRAVAVQLAAYRVAWAELAGVPLERVRAAFHYVRGDKTVRPVDLPDADGLARLIREVPEE